MTPQGFPPQHVHPPIPVAPIPEMAHPGFTPEQIMVIEAAKRRYKIVRREISVTTFYAWSVAIFAGLSLAMSATSLPDIKGALPGILTSLALGAFAVFEFRLLKRLQALDVNAPRLLGWNHLFLSASLILYALYSLMAPPPESLKEVANVMPDAAALVGLITLCIYGGVIAVALFAEGGCAIYHFTRTSHLRQFVQETPGWVLQLHTVGLLR